MSGAGVDGGMEEISTDAAPAAIGPYSQGIRDGDRLFVSGQGPVDPATGEVIDGDAAAQTDRVMDNVAAILDAAGASLDDVVKTTVFLADMADYETVNEAYAARLSRPYPSRSAVEVAEIPLAADVEIEAVASLRD
jgi:reactive intermediate/imine deaminase